jgi:hypothetical protein
MCIKLGPMTVAQAHVFPISATNFASTLEEGYEPMIIPPSSFPCSLGRSAVGTPCSLLPPPQLLHYTSGNPRNTRSVHWSLRPPAVSNLPPPPHGPPTFSCVLPTQPLARGDKFRSLHSSPFRSTRIRAPTYAHTPTCTHTPTLATGVRCFSLQP